jgi:hypothetical protein
VVPEEDVTAVAGGPGPGDPGDGVWQQMLNALVDPVVVLGPSGMIVAVNDAWRAFAAAVGEPSAAEAGRGLRRVLPDGDGTPSRVTGVVPGSAASDAVKQQLSETQAQLADLQAAFDRRAVIEQAKGVLMARRGVDADAAFALLRAESQRRGRKVAALAQHVVDCHGLFGDVPG